MPTSQTTRSSADVAMEVTSLSAGLGIIGITLSPLMLPGLVLVLGPLALVAVAGLLLAAPLLLPIWLARIVQRRRAREGHRPSRRAAARSACASGAGP